ncbi:MAG TPA: hypothetical protein VK784_00915, partial [Pseudonocardiaceae bacterium]|nr:hypothetical protein [Pseudonocardiaceae bacterium]
MAEVRIVQVIVHLCVRQQGLVSELIAVIAPQTGGLQTAGRRGSEQTTDAPLEGRRLRPRGGHSRQVPHCQRPGRRGEKTQHISRQPIVIAAEQIIDLLPRQRRLMLRIPERLHFHRPR